MTDLAHYLGLLRLYDAFDAAPEPGRAVFSYDLAARELVELRRRYPIATASGSGTVSEQVQALMRWLCEHTHHNGAVTKELPINALDLLAFAFDGHPDHGIDCRMLATILTESLLALGITSRIVSLHPLHPYDSDNHVVTLAWDPDLAKWFMADPTFNACVRDARGTLLAPWELRAALIAGDAVSFNPDAHYGDHPLDPDEYLAYLARHLFYMHSPRYSTFGSEDREGQQWWVLVPRGFDGRRRQDLLVQHLQATLGQLPDIGQKIQHMLTLYAELLASGAYHFSTDLAAFTAAP